MQNIIERLQTDQNNLKNQFDLLLIERNSARRIMSPINFNKTSPSSELNTVVLPAASANSKHSIGIYVD